MLHAWLKEELTAVLAELPAAPAPTAMTTAVPPTGAAWQRWREGLSIATPPSPDLPPLRMLLVLDNLAGHRTPDFVRWLYAHGVMPLYTPLGGSWLNMAESLQRILKRRALEGQEPGTPTQIIAWFEAVAEHWNRAPTPFVWGGKRAVRRQRQRERRHRLGGSGACAGRQIERPGAAYGHAQQE